MLKCLYTFFLEWPFLTVLQFEDLYVDFISHNKEYSLDNGEMVKYSKHYIAIIAQYSQQKNYYVNCFMFYYNIWYTMVQVI